MAKIEFGTVFHTSVVFLLLFYLELLSISFPVI